MTDAVTLWVDGYRRAWESNDPDDIRALFAEDAVYRPAPHDDAPWRGHDQIVAGWLRDRDEARSTTFDWHPLAVTDDVAIVQGETVYLGGPRYSNLWVIRLDADGRAREFTEWYMEQG